MPKETVSYTTVIRESQQEWQNWRATGLKSLTRLHQTIELPSNLADQFQHTLIDALPINPSIKQTLKTEHPPLIMGWALGPDDRIRLKTFKSKSLEAMHIPDILNSKQTDIYVNGMHWVEEAIIEDATKQIIHSLCTLPIQSRSGMLSRIFLHPSFEISDFTTKPKQLIQLHTLLQNPKTRTDVLNTWFSGNTDRADTIIHRATGLSLTGFTYLIGKINDYLEFSDRIADKNEDSGNYILGHGIAYMQGKRFWLWPLIADVFVHETMHYLSEGNNHRGWYPETYKIRKL